jgi:hypothetical protein
MAAKEGATAGRRPEGIRSRAGAASWRVFIGIGGRSARDER